MRRLARGTQVNTIDEYIAGCAPQVRPMLRKIRAAVRGAVPQATEQVSYGMPAFKLDRIIIYFAAFERHIGIFPPVRDAPALLKAVKPFAGPKGNLKFPLTERIPYALIARVAKHHAKRRAAPRVVKGGAARKRSLSRTLPPA